MSKRLPWPGVLSNVMVPMALGLNFTYAA